MLAVEALFESWLVRSPDAAALTNFPESLRQ